MLQSVHTMPCTYPYPKSQKSSFWPNSSVLFTELAIAVFVCVEEALGLDIRQLLCVEGGVAAALLIIKGGAVAMEERPCMSRNTRSSLIP
jgi:hypothetical protein